MIEHDKKRSPVIVTPSAEEMLVRIPADSRMLEGDLAIPEGARSLVVFAYGSGGSRESPRNKFLSSTLLQGGIGTLVADLLTVKEETVRTMRHNIELMTHRLEAVTQWARSEPDLFALRIGFLGLGTGAALALGAAADLTEAISAVVVRGGRPDLAVPDLSSVTAPTLFILPGLDNEAVEPNRGAYAMIKAKKELRIIPAATHLFEEPGTMEAFAQLAIEWFKQHLEAR